MEPLDIRQLLRELGLRATRQRTLVVGILEKGQHLDAAGVLQAARSRGEGISLATVYRTLNSLEAFGLVDRRFLNADHDREYYELSRGLEHYHLTCRGCGRVFEFRTQRLSQLRSDLQSSSGWKLEQMCICLEGYCPECAPLSRKGQQHAACQTPPAQAAR